MKSYTCLMYHEIATPAKNKYYVPLDVFKRQMALLGELGISTLSLEEGWNKSDDRQVLLTFDDGHGSNFEAARFMASLGLKGYFYVVKDFSLHNPDYLSEDEIGKMAEMGHSIAIHGKNHKWWTRKSDQQLLDELGETKEWIEGITKRMVITCAAPGGFVDQRVIDTIHRGLPEVEYIRTVEVGLNHYDDKVIRIIPMHTTTTLDMFKWGVCCNPAFYAYQRAIYDSKKVLKRIYCLLGGEIKEE